MVTPVWISTIDVALWFVNRASAVTLKLRWSSAPENCRALLGLLPLRRQVWHAKYANNEIYLLCAVFAHNLSRELHMIANPPDRNTTEKRSPLWVFTRLDTLRSRLLRRAGRLIRPKGKLTLSMSTNEAVCEDMTRYLSALKAVA